MKVKYENHGEIKRKLNSLIPEAKSRTKAALSRELHLILKASQSVQPSVPKNTGALASTGKVEEPKEAGDLITGSVTYGGKAPEPHGRTVRYAQVVHDKEGIEYKKKGAGPGYVESHVNRAKIKKAVRDAFLGK